MSTVAATSAATTDSLQKAIQDTTSKRFADEVTSKIMDLRTSDADLMKYLMDKSVDASQSQLMGMQLLIQSRSQLVGTLTNMLRTMGEAAQRIIQNFR